MSSTTYARHWLKQAIFTNEVRLDGETVTKRHYFASIGNMVRNAGELPQPFWLGAACGGGSCSLSASVARA